MAHELEADIYYLTSEEGGRKNGVSNGYRGQLYYYGRDWDAAQVFVDKETCLPGETAKVCLTTLSPEQHIGMFHVGQNFEIREGCQTIGRGIIRRIMRPDFECKVDWTKLKEEIYYEDGSLRDIYVLNTTAEDWQKWIKWIQASYRIEWFDPRIGTFIDHIDFSVIREFWNSIDPSRSIPMVRIFIEHIQINAHFFLETEIENDIDPTVIRSWGDHVRLLNYTKIMSHVLNKQVILTSENVRDRVLLSLNDTKHNSTE